MKILVPGARRVALLAAARISRFTYVFAVISSPYTACIYDLIQSRQEQENPGEIA